MPIDMRSEKRKQMGMIVIGIMLLIYAFINEKPAASIAAALILILGLASLHHLATGKRNLFSRYPEDTGEEQAASDNKNDNNNSKEGM